MDLESKKQVTLRIVCIIVKTPGLRGFIKKTNGMNNILKGAHGLKIPVIKMGIDANGANSHYKTYQMRRRLDKGYVGISKISM